jgi:DNA modification methylase
VAVKEQIIKDNYAIYCGDCIDVMSDMPSDSIHFSVYSPPFGGLYNYSSDERDISNCSDYKEFLVHYGYVIKEKARITMPGRCTAVHCTDIPSGNCGKDFLIDLPGDIIREHDKRGWKFIARHTIWKEPLWVRNRTMTKNLAHKTVVDDAVYGGVASADYLLVFRKKGENKIPVSKPSGLDHYAGECPIPEELHKYRFWKGDQTENRYSHWIWRRYASSIWDDIDIGRVLPFRDSKGPDDEKHVHPLQLDVIDRAVTLRTNIGETVFTPFMGVGSEVYVPVTLGRRGIGVELKSSYFKQAAINLEKAVVGTYHTNNYEQLKLSLWQE